MALYTFRYQGIDISTDKLIEFPETSSFAFSLPKESNEAKQLIELQDKIFNSFVSHNCPNEFQEFCQSILISKDSEKYAWCTNSYICKRVYDTDNWLFYFNYQYYFSKTCCKFR